MNLIASTNKPPKLLLLASMLYVTLMIICTVLVHKTIQLIGYPAPAAALLVPFWFLGGDIITEVYGLSIAKQCLWIGIFCQTVFVVVVTMLSSIHSNHKPR